MKSPIIAFLGHVDAGKTSIMDAIRNTYFAYRESGGLTQNIGITEVPTNRIKELCSDLLKKFNVNIQIPSIIFIDSPGHEAFTSLRERGASIADLAVLTIDSTAGIQTQTLESLEILKSYKTPFLIAFTKIDRLESFIPKTNMSFSDFISTQNEKYKMDLDKRIYDLISELSNIGFNAERFDRVRDFTKEIAIVPVSAINNIGIDNLIVLIIGLSQKYINLSDEGSTKGEISLLEEKEIKGIGKVYDAIVYSGMINVGDRVITITKDGPSETKIKGIMRLIPLEESRENFGKYEYIKEAKATTPIRLILQAPEAIIGTSAITFKSEQEKQEIIDSIKSMEINSTDENKQGIVVCADSIGSLDAIKKIGKDENIEIGFTKIGQPTKKILAIAKSNGNILLCFNVTVPNEVEELARESGIKIISKKSIYELFQAYHEFLSEKSKETLDKKLSSITLPAKFVVLKDVFHRSNPCIVGIEILAGEIRQNYPIINEQNKRIGRIVDIQLEKRKIQNAKIGDKVAVSIDDAVYGRNIKEGQILYSDITNNDIINFLEIKDKLPEDYSNALEEIRKIKGF